MYKCEIAVVGGGPAGLCAALEAADLGASVTLLDRDPSPGGQLVKQTHRFFGAKAQYAGTRGIDIAHLLVDQVQQHPLIELHVGSDVLAYYPDGVLAYEQEGRWHKVLPKRTIFATGASERYLAFPGADLPGVYGAGAVQTLMNVHGVRPARRVVMVGAGNIGLIVSYQLLQAGVDVAAIVEASPRVGGYVVHASKIRRMGVPIHTQHTVVGAWGDNKVEGVTVMELDADWQPIAGTEQDIECDSLCLAVGLNPLVDLLWQCGCTMAWVSQLGGYVPLRDEKLETTIDGVYVAGDVSGIEEASAAMMEGQLAGLNCAHSLGYGEASQVGVRRQEILAELAGLRAGPKGCVTRDGIDYLQRARPVRQCLIEGSGA